MSAGGLRRRFCRLSPVTGNRDLDRDAGERASRARMVGYRLSAEADHSTPAGTLGNPKSHAGQRSIPMSPYLVNTLREWKIACRIGARGLVFPNGAGNVERYSNLTCRAWYPLQIQAG